MKITQEQIQEIQDLLHKVEEAQEDNPINPMRLDQSKTAVSRFIMGKVVAYKRVLKILNI